MGKFETPFFKKGFQEKKEYLGIIEEIDERGYAKITQRNKFCVGDTIEIMKPDGRNVPVVVEDMFDSEGAHVDSAPHPQQELYLKLSEVPQQYDLLRVAKEEEQRDEHCSDN